MAESDLSIPYSELKSEVGRFLGYGSASAGWSAEQLSEIDSYVQAGLRKFYYPPAVEGVEPGYNWSFLNPTAQLATVANQRTQDLPDSLGRVLGNFHYNSDQFRKSVYPVSEERYQALLSRSDDTGQPDVCRIRQKPKEDGQGTRWEVSWWPLPGAAYTLTYQYERFQGKLSDSNPYPAGGMRHAELVLQACLSVAEIRANDEKGIHNAEFAALLASMVEQDRRVGARHFGYMGSPEVFNTIPRHGDTGNTYDITYKGTTH